MTTPDDAIITFDPSLACWAIIDPHDMLQAPREGPRRRVAITNRSASAAELAATMDLIERQCPMPIDGWAVAGAWFGSHESTKLVCVMLRSERLDSLVGPGTLAVQPAHIPAWLPEAQDLDAATLNVLVGPRTAPLIRRAVHTWQTRLVAGLGVAALLLVASALTLGARLRAQAHASLGVAADYLAALDHPPATEHDASSTLDQRLIATSTALSRTQAAIAAEAQTRAGATPSTHGNLRPPDASDALAEAFAALAGPWGTPAYPAQPNARPPEATITSVSASPTQLQLVLSLPATRAGNALLTRTTAALNADHRWVTAPPSTSLTRAQTRVTLTRSRAATAPLAPPHAQATRGATP